MNTIQFLLIKLAEEASEVAQIALKAAQFGPQEQCVGMNEDNAGRVAVEVDDMMGVLCLLSVNGVPYEPNPEAIADKCDRLLEYARYSATLGEISENVPYDLQESIALVNKKPFDDDAADADRFRWLLDGNGYFMEEESLCGHPGTSNEERRKARRAIDNAMKVERDGHV